MNFKKQKLHVEWIECLKREYYKSKYFDQIKDDYMPRNLRQSLQIDRNVQEKKEMGHVVKNVQSEEEFNEICGQNAEIENINFHIESKIVFFWRK